MRAMLGLVLVMAGGIGCDTTLSREEHKAACGRYANIHVEAELDQRVKDVAEDMKEKVRADAKAELESEGRHKAFVDRCVLETKGAGQTFATCMDGATGLTDSNRCVEKQVKKAKSKAKSTRASSSSSSSSSKKAKPKKKPKKKPSK